MAPCGVACEVVYMVSTVIYLSNFMFLSVVNG